MFGTPIAFGIVSIIHPLPFGPSIVAAVQPQLGVWLAVHVVQFFLIGLLGLTVWLLVAGLSGRAATVCRLALIPFLVFYAGFDAIVGLGTGQLVLLAQRLPAGEQAVTARLIQHFWDARLDVSTPVPYVILLGALSWVITALAAAVALRRAGASWATVTLLALAGLFFGIDHPFPTGTAAMICLFAAVVLLERQRSRNRHPISATPTNK
jgi:hypothetical protein